MLSELPEIEIPGPEGWNIRQDKIGTGPTHKSFDATPKERLVVDYVTWEKYRDRLIDAVYPAQVVDANVTYYWHEDTQEWKPTRVNIRVQLLNPRTMQPYSHRNPLGAVRHIRDLMFSESDEIPTSREKIERVILDATRPQTKITITITEEPLHV